MSDPVTYPDAERLLVDLVSSFDLGVRTVGVGVPSNWRKNDSPAHYQIDTDGEFLTEPIAAASTVRVVVWESDTTTAKARAHEVQGRLLAYRGDSDIVRIRHLTGVLPALEPGGKAELASFTVQVVTRSIPL